MKTKRETRIACLKRQREAVLFTFKPFLSFTLDFSSFGNPFVLDNARSFSHG
jgi:hypothetical protein